MHRFTFGPTARIARGVALPLLLESRNPMSIAGGESRRVRAPSLPTGNCQPTPDHSMIFATTPAPTVRPP
ncbi:MAG TPA: hypothetical protein PLM09_16445, partial [Casimicrobiaceae bacterium]|nr:hypothetical protein [Casimicrobiaceae bacterium]